MSDHLRAAGFFPSCHALLLGVVLCSPANAAGIDADAAAATNAASKQAVESPLASLSPAKRAKLERKTQGITDRRFGDPDLAEQFYVNSRTGPVITRGPNFPMADRTLSPDMYQAGLEQMRQMQRISSATGAITPSLMQQGAGTDDAFSATPGNALGVWSNVGPSNQGGRTRSILIDPVNPNIMYSGGVAGGVWKSTDAGATWSTNTDQMANLAVVTLVFDPSNTNTIYAGTGEGVGNADAIRGAGIFKSTDAGLTWNQLSSTNNASFHYTQKILVSPRNPQRIWAATRLGVFRSLDAGATFTLEPSVSASTGCTDMAMQVNNPTTGYLFVSCGRTSGQGTIWRAEDTDTSTFTSVLSLAGQGRSSIAVAPSNESVIYVLAAQRTGGVTGLGPGLGGLHGVYRSTANGDAGSFTTQRQGNSAFTGTADKINKLLLSNPVVGLLTECGFGTSSLLNQGWYDNVIAVDPLDSDKVWIGGIDVWRSDNGGVDWGTASYWWFDKESTPSITTPISMPSCFTPATTAPAIGSCISAATAASAVRWMRARRSTRRWRKSVARRSRPPRPSRIAAMASSPRSSTMAWPILTAADILADCRTTAPSAAPVATGAGACWPVATAGTWRWTP
ncbi:MAG: exo-alpha-sialidase [Rhodanobacteraceae bacterium]|nr:exo-alpha-sialidase [Rhodanobacteraceae bacterium]